METLRKIRGTIRKTKKVAVLVSGIPVLVQKTDLIHKLEEITGAEDASEKVAFGFDEIEAGFLVFGSDEDLDLTQRTPAPATRAATSEASSDDDGQLDLEDFI